MTGHQRALRRAYWKGAFGLIALFLIVTIIGPTLA